MAEDDKLIRISPIKRLRRILKKITRVKSEVDILTGWKEVFSLAPEAEAVEVYPHIVAFKELLDECIILVEKEADPGTKIKYLQHLKPIEKMINNCAMTNPMHSLQNIINPIMLENLEFCDIELSKIASEVEIKKEEIKELIDEINVLKEKIYDSTIDPQIKKLTLELLKSLEMALIDYQILGIESLEKTIDKEFTSIAIVCDQLDKELKGESSSFKNIFGKIGSFIMTAEKTYAFYTFAYAIIYKGAEMIEAIKRMLPPP